MAALPDTADTDTKEESEEEEGGAGEGAELGLGAEAGSHAPQPCVAKLLLARRRHPARPLTHSDTAASFRSTASHLSVSRSALTSTSISMSSMLYLIFNISNNITQCAAWTRPCCSPAPRTRRSCSTTSASGARTSSPGQLSLVGRHRDTVMLISHWSGSPPGSCGTSPRPAASPWSPSSRGRRTRTPGTVRCTMLYCTVLYCAVDTRVEFGFAGYRGLHGSPSRRPSEIVEKILHTLVSWVWHGAAADVLAVFDDVWKKPLHWDACLQVVSNSSL